MRTPLTACLISIALLAAALTGYWLLYSAVVDKSVAVVERTQEVEAKVASVKRARSIEAVLADVARQEALVKSYVVPETGVVAFIDDLESRGRSLGTVVEIDTVARAPKGRPALTLSLGVTGTFDAVMRTVGAIEHAPYDLTVTNFSIFQGLEEQDPWVATLNLFVGSATSTPSS
jgi:hypothetical protein